MVNFHKRSIRFRLGEYEGRNRQRDTQLTGQCLDRSVVLIAALSNTSVIAPVRPNAAIFRNSSLIVSVLTTVVLVTAISWRVTAFHAPKTLNR